MVQIDAGHRPLLFPQQAVLIEFAHLPIPQQVVRLGLTHLFFTLQQVVQVCADPHLLLFQQ